MQDGWERHGPLIIPERPVLQTIVEAAIPGARVLSASPLSGGLSNTTLRMDLDGTKPVVLRLYGRDPTALPRDRALLQWAENTLPTPRFLGADSDGAPAPWLLMSFIEGEPLDTVIERGDWHALERAATDLGRIRGAMDTFAFDAPGLLGPTLALETPFESFSALMTGYLGPTLASKPAQDRLDRRLETDLMAFVDARLPLLTPYEGRYALTHADFKPCNILVAPSGEVRALLDWEFAFSGIPIFDLAMMLRYRDALPHALPGWLSQGYRGAGGFLTDDWPEVARLIDLVNLCGFLSRPGDRPNMVAEVLGLVRATLYRK